MQGFIHQLFSKVVFETRLNNSKKDLNKFIKDFKNFKVKDTNEKKNITRATESKYILNDERFKELRKVLLQQFYSFKNEALLFNNTDFEITTSWLAVSSTNCEGVPHNHRNSFYSGVYYLKVPKKSGGIKFINYNTSNTKKGKGSAIFIHLTRNFKSTAGCIALQKKDFLILLKIIDKYTKIKIL